MLGYGVEVGVFEAMAGGENGRRWPEIGLVMADAVKGKVWSIEVRERIGEGEMNWLGQFECYMVFGGRAKG